MYIDSRLQFDDGHSLTATAASTNVIDLGADRDIGVGRPMWVIIQVDTAAGGTSPTFKTALQTDSDSAFGSATDIASVTIPSDAAAGDRFVIGVPNANERYLRLNHTLGGTSPTIKLSAWLTDQEPPKWQAYAANSQ